MAEHAPVPRREGRPTRRVTLSAPHARVQEYLEQVRAGGQRGPDRFGQPPSMTEGAWAQVRATLSALNCLTRGGQPTTRLHNLVRDEISILDVLRLEVPDAVEAVDRGDPDLATDLLEIASAHSRKRALAFIRAALSASGSMPRSRSSARRTTDPATPPAAAASPLSEAGLLQHAMDEALALGDIERAGAIQVLLHRVPGYSQPSEDES